MQLETMRMLADWLKYGTNGPSGAAGGPSSVNALLVTVPQDAGDPDPTPIATFGDETRSWWLARREIPRQSDLVYPALGVLTTEASDLDGEVATCVRDGIISTTIAYAVQEVVTEDAVRDWLYTSRVVQQSVRAWLSNANASFRTRNSIAVLACQSMRPVPFYETRGDLVISGGITLRLNVRDTAP